ncbi:RsmE family RNA methyltransferase [Desulfobotulus sp. H1]|uniref:16S rRNA (uracil(1498)-N(3))-methyltransferase n=1 Tax=Desulfobotulus pelophilus TaxID=2823377 RepID=A0ABT3N6W4_9BACT|nr:RsmE family RNA methyltransferase [Desulfobotulus pelophilus]MCW7753203.1 RsmE family RNA methyltransferase [Desulfobotulus pelophilus]
MEQEQFVHSPMDSRIELARNPEKTGEAVELTPGAFRALEIWQARPGEVMTVTAPDGTLFRGRLLGERGAIHGVLCFENMGRIPAEVSVHLCQALPEKERFELVMEKAVELGINGIHPFVSRRSATLAMRDASQKKSHRWPHLVRRASRQCRRADVPALYPVADWASVLLLAEKAGLCLVLDEREKEFSFMDGLSAYRQGDVVLIVGPEGGLDREEVRALRGAGALPVTLGPRILRTETAAIVASALIRHCLK